MTHPLIEHAIVTGACGFLGQALVRSLVRQGTDVIAIDRDSADLPCEFVKADLERPFVLDEFLTPASTLFHLAAHASVAGSVRDPRLDFNTNVAAFLEVLESVRKAGAGLVFPSSSAVFCPDQELPHRENAHKSPSSPYAAAKLACEGYCAAYHKCYGLDVKVARLFNVYGVGMRRFAIYDFYQKIRRDSASLEILGDGFQVRDYLYIDDLVEGLAVIATRGQSGEDYNLSSGVPTTSLDLARQVAAIMGCPDIEITFKGASFPGDVPRWYADIDKVQGLGFSPTIPLIKGLELTIDWLNHVHVENSSE